MSPQTPSPNYDFILHGDQKPKKRFSLPRPNLPKPIALALVGVLIFFLLIVVYALFSGSGAQNSELATAAARAQEISRVSALVGQQATDASVKSLAATVQTTLNSDVAQIQNYLVESGGKKIGANSLAIYKDSSSDTQVQTAVQNNAVSAFFNNYLKDNLAAYQASLQAAYKSASVKAKTILSNAYTSSQTLLSGL